MTSSQRLGNTGSHNFSRESIIRIILFTSGCWGARRRDTGNYLTGSRQGEVRILINIYLHWILYQVLDESKIIHLFIHFRSTLWPLEGSSTIGQARKGYVMLTQICFQSGDAFGWCSKGLTVMVLNISGVIRTDKLRTILLFKAHLNFSNKLYFGSKLTKRAESSGILPQE